MTWQSYIEVGGWIVAGIFVVLGMFGMNTRVRRQENDGVADNLINNLQKTVDLQKAEIDGLNTKREVQGQEIAHLQGRLATMMEILQGRDPVQSAFFKEAPSLFAIARENNELAKSTSEAVAHLAEAVETLVNSLTPHEA